MWDRRGRGGPIRTGDHLNPIQVRYQAALRPDTGHYTKVQAVWQGVPNGVTVRWLVLQFCQSFDWVSHPMVGLLGA
jgi:hypothetical protein